MSIIIYAVIPLQIFLAAYIMYAAYKNDREETKRIEMAEKMSFENQVLSNCVNIDDPKLKPELEKLAEKYGVSTDVILKVLRSQK